MVALRQHVSISDRGVIGARNVRMTRAYDPIVYLRRNDVTRLEIDFTPFLASGETISAATVTNTGVTATVANTTTSVTLTISAATTNGKIVLKTTLTTGDIVNTTIWARLQDTAPSTTDYVIP